MSWQSFSKVELHLHLEGAAPPAFIGGWRRREEGSTSGASSAEDGSYAYENFEHFLTVYRGRLHRSDHARGLSPHAPP